MSTQFEWMINRRKKNWQSNGFPLQLPGLQLTSEAGNWVEESATCCSFTHSQLKIVQQINGNQSMLITELVFFLLSLFLFLCLLVDPGEQQIVKLSLSTVLRCSLQIEVENYQKEVAHCILLLVPDYFKMQFKGMQISQT